MRKKNEKRKVMNTFPILGLSIQAPCMLVINLRAYLFTNIQVIKLWS